MENLDNKQVQITMQSILDVFKSYSDYKRLKDIKNAVVASLTGPDEIFNFNQAEIEDEIERLIKQDRKRDKDSKLTYNKGKYSKRKSVRPPLPGDPIDHVYVGRAGECAVMSELLFHGYNANMMLVDEGVDIVAVKDNIYYYVQVKTTYVRDNGNIICQIDIDRYDQYIGKQIRYFIVARSKEKDSDRNIFFMFTPDKLDEAIHEKCIKRGERGVSVKIKFNTSGQPVLYDEKEMSISYYMNKFEL